MANFPPYPYGGYQPMQMPQMTTQIPMPQMAPQMPQTGQMSGGGLSPMSRPVSSREEAQACAADFSGALMIFPDLAHSRVYLKRWNMQTGAADFVEFGPVADAPAEEVPQAEYVCLQTYQEDMEKLRKELAGIKKVIISDE
jgi:hypothetical protein